MHQTEILKMKAEFSKDENGTIWFTYASNIGQRRCKGKEHIQHSQTQISEINKQNKEKMLLQLEAHQAKTAADPNSQNIIKKMFDKMGEHYEKMKEEVGLKDAFEKSDDEEEQTEAIFRKLRPHSKYKFSDVLHMQEKMNPRQINKMIGPMAVISRDKAPRSLAEIAPIDPLIQDLLQSGARRSKQRHDRHRFAEKPMNPRALHN